jgi:hypothetical protein
MTSKRALLTFAICVLGIFGVAVTLGLASSKSNGSPKSTFSLDRARSFTEFPVYSAGSAVDGLPLVAVLRRDDTANYVSFVYGECDATNETGCAPPAEVQVWPACGRNPSLYAGPRAPVSPVPTPTTVRGVPAAFFEDGARLEIQTGASTVVVFGESRERVLRVADALRGVNVDVLPGSTLPAPAPGALDGTLRCR